MTLPHLVRNLSRTVVRLTAAVAVFAVQTLAQQGVNPAPQSPENFDIRSVSDAASQAYMERFAARPSSPGVAALARARIAGLARLEANLKVDVIDSPELGTPEVVSVKPGTGFLTPPAADRAGALRGFLSAYADAYGLSPEQVASLNLTANYADPGGNMSWVEFEQLINGLPVFRAVIRGGFTASGELARTTGPLASGLNGGLLPVSPALTAAQAVSRAAANVGWNVPAGALVQKTSERGRVTFDRGPMADDAKAGLLYFPLAPGVARLAWSTEIWGDPDAFLVLLDAEDGTVLFRKNLTNHESPATQLRTESGSAIAQLTSSSGFAAKTPDETVAPPALDFVGLRSYLRTASGGGGVEVDIPTIGQTVFFYSSVQVFGTGSSATLSVRAVLDGVPFCTQNYTGAPGASGFVACPSGPGWQATSGPHTLEWQLDYNNTVPETDETNNSTTKTFTSSAATLDLVAQRAYMRTAAAGGIEVLDQPVIGDTVFFHHDWQLTGTGAAVFVSLRALLDGNVFCTSSVQANPPVSLTAWCDTGWVATAGSHSLQWDLDDTSTISEKNEGNNSATKTFTPSSTQGTQPATYVIYDNDSPAPLSPTNVLPGTGTQAGYVSQTTKTLIGNEAPNTFNNLGWMKDGANVTDGNNVQAGLDRDFIDGVDAPVAGVSRVFNFAYNPATDSATTPAYQNGEVTDTFYWTNVYHDRLYLLGFTEAAGNFQNDNFGRGGAAGDRIRAESQDYSSLNNANFSTPADGSRPRMQMYIFSGPNPVRPSGVDHDVLLHELTHGTSNRLHNNASGLTTTMSKGMGEGWSDFYARALLSSAAEDPNGVYAAGGWITYLLGTGYTDNYYYGIRRFPYAVWSNLGSNGKPHNPLTFADIDGAQISTTDGAYSNNPLIINDAFEVHNIGEIWCMALLEVRARFITRLGFATGNQRFLQYVTDGMKLDPVNPTLLQGRDSIIAAANAGGGSAADIDDIWNGFAIRGMGYSAQVINVTLGMVKEAFDVPRVALGGSTLVTESIPNGSIDQGELLTLSLCVTNTTAGSSGSISGSLLATGGVTSPSGAQSYGSIPSLGTVCRNFTFTAAAACGGTLTATLQALESGAAAHNLTYSFQVGATAPLFIENFDSVVVPALPAGWTTSRLAGTTNLWVTNASSSASAPNQAFAANPSTSSDNVLVSPAIPVPAGPTVLSFRHLFNVETSFDGGVFEVAIAGGAFQDIVTAGGTFASGAYAGTITSLNNRKAWTGNSGSYVTTTVNMPAAAAGQNVQLRWRMASDSSVGSTGWSVDSIALSIFQCGRRKRGQLISD